jgi:hypothetical protein
MREPTKQSPGTDRPKPQKGRDKPQATGNKRLAEQIRNSRQALREQISGPVSRDRCASRFWMRPGPPHGATLSLIFSHVAESDRRRGASASAEPEAETRDWPTVE